MNPNQPTSPSGAARPQSVARPSGRVFDVMRPGQAPAAPYSRPVVIGSQPTARSAQAAVSGVGERAQSPAVNAPVPSAQPVAPVPVQSAAAPAEPQSIQPAPQPIVAPIPPAVSSSVGTPPSSVAVSQPSAVPSMSDQPVQNDDSLYASAAPTLDAAPPPTGIKQKHSVWPMIIVIVVIVLLAAVIIDILMDAAIITIPGIPHTTFL